MNRQCFLTLLVCALSLAVCGCSSDSTDSAGNDPQLNLSGSNQGQSASFVDVDGDGIEDKLVGAPYALISYGSGAAAATGTNTGAVLVYKGTGSSYGSQPMMVMTGDDNFGFAMTNAGDVDHDGKDDFAVGAITGSGDEASSASLSGTVTVYKGGAKWQVIKKLAGDDPMAKFGLSVAAGDLNNDGYSDIVVGAPFNTNDPALYQSGAAFVFLGPDLNNRISLYATTTHKGLGWKVATGDINGDGTSDLLISASGKVLGFYGGLGVFNPSMASPDLVVKSAASGFGKAMAVVGDYNGDGMKEIAIGAPNATINGNRDTGSVYIVKGDTGIRSIDLGATPAPADQLVRIDGNALFDRFGYAISAADVDSDSIPDLMVGAPWADVNPNDLAGRVYLFNGKDINASSTLASATGFAGMVKNQGFGTTLTCNKKCQILVGGPRATIGSGGVALVDPQTGSQVPGGSSGGTTGGGGDCH